MHSVLLITLYSFFTAVLMLIVKGNSMKTANYEAFTKGTNLPEKATLGGGYGQNTSAPVFLSFVTFGSEGFQSRMEVTLLIVINILVLATVNAIVLIVLSIRTGTKTYLLGWSLLFYSLFFLVYFLWFHAGWILKFPHLIRTVNPLMFLTAPFFYFLYPKFPFRQTRISLKGCPSLSSCTAACAGADALLFDGV